MSRTVESIFRPFNPSDAERSDRSAGDRARHRLKVRESIRENIADIIAEESIIGKDREKIIKVPIRGIREYKFRYGENTPGGGQGNGQSQTGQVVGKAEQAGKGEDKAGDQPGSDYYETDVTLEELIDIMFEDLELPDLERKALRQIEAYRLAKRKGYRAVGIRVRLDKRRTVRERGKRELASPHAHPIQARYHPSLWNVYSFHCSDGDNFDSDNPAALRTAKELAEVCNLFGYGEIKPLGSRYYESSMLNIFRRLDADNFQTVLIERKEDIWPSFKAFLAKDRGREQAA